ncbi:MAG TPA: hypothetical protein VME23_13775 [Terracidiphilus sp.]|nr:hypothetical protein [Terracidiphilus sp.]
MLEKTTFALMLTVVIASPLSVRAIRPSKNPMLKAQVRFLATSTSIHAGIGRRQDVYLVEIELPGFRGQSALARLIDDYPPYRVAIPREQLTSELPVNARVRRDRTCDLSFALIPLRTPPGDPMAILPEPLGFEPTLPRPVAPDELLPCYRTVRR